MRSLSGLGKLVGFGLSMAMLAVASLFIIPSMIRASGEDVWGSSIYLGQSVGAIGAMLVLYGWSISGPAEIARGTAQSQLEEFWCSLKLRCTLFPVAAVVLMAISIALAPVRKDLAAIGTVVTLATGLIQNWFFVGLARPYVLMAVETVPRLAFTIVGIATMELNPAAGAGIGLVWQGAGVLAGAGLSTWWILHHLAKAGARKPKLPTVRALLVNHRHGVASSLGSGLYTLLPLVVVNMVAIGAAPMYGLVDKLHSQIIVGLFPAIYVLQGWVPRAANPGPRARQVMWAGLGLSALIVAATYLIGPWLLHFTGAGKLVPTAAVVALMALGLGLHFYVETVAHAILATYRRLRVLTWSIVIAMVVTLPLVGFCAVNFDVPGALAAVCVGYLIRAAVAVVVSLTCIRGGVPSPEGPADLAIVEEVG